MSDSIIHSYYIPSPFLFPLPFPLPLQQCHLSIGQQCHLSIGDDGGGVGILGVALDQYYMK